jgi:hypothetical protein
MQEAISTIEISTVNCSLRRSFNPLSGALLLASSFCNVAAQAALKIGETGSVKGVAHAIDASISNCFKSIASNTNFEVKSE